MVRTEEEADDDEGYYEEGADGGRAYEEALRLNQQLKQLMLERATQMRIAPSGDGRGTRRGASLPAPQGGRPRQTFSFNDAPPGRASHVSSEAINRRKRSESMAKENRALVQRLEGVRSSGLGRVAGRVTPAAAAACRLTGGGRCFAGPDPGRLTRPPNVKPHGRPRMEQPEWQS
mmetsp:Transcript_79514/g.170411  ORF Transcript_79514/g.170411 Transcript_79514/m.170411 type:complete len:175 (+) Transcript_79514:89-613(+)